MITDGDILKLKKTFLTKEDIGLIIDAQKTVFATKDDFDELRKDFSQLQTSVDGYAKKMNDHDIEIKVLNHRVKKLENPA